MPPEIQSIFPRLTKDEAIEKIAAAERPYRDRYLAEVVDVHTEFERLVALFIEGADKKAVRVRLKALGPEFWPRCLLERYRVARRWKERALCVFAAIFEARDSEMARELGRLALEDRASTVRWRAHQVLAYSLDRSFLAVLTEALKAENRADLRESLKAAINAIKAGDRNLYLDRRRQGNVHWNVQPWEGGDPAVQRGILAGHIRETIEGWKTKI